MSWAPRATLLRTNPNSGSFSVSSREQGRGSSEGGLPGEERMTKFHPPFHPKSWAFRLCGTPGGLCSKKRLPQKQMVKPSNVFLLRLKQLDWYETEKLRKTIGWVTVFPPGTRFFKFSPGCGREESPRGDQQEWGCGVARAKCMQLATDQPRSRIYISRGPNIHK